jgi:hypothetical protein
VREEPRVFVEAGIEGRAVGDVDPGDVEVTRVEADAEPRVPVEPLEQGRQLVERAADRAPGARGVLHQEPRVARAALEDLRHRGHDAVESLVEAGAEMRADVEDDRVGLDRARDVDRRAHRRDRLVVDLVRRGEVAEVERVARDAADTRLRAARLEPLD